LQRENNGFLRKVHEDRRALASAVLTIQVFSMDAACAADAESPGGGVGFAGSLQHHVDLCSIREVLHMGWAHAFFRSRDQEGYLRRTTVPRICNAAV
jgi:hypothetical protein